MILSSFHGDWVLYMEDIEPLLSYLKKADEAVRAAMEAMKPIEPLQSEYLELDYLASRLSSLQRRIPSKLTG